MSCLARTRETAGTTERRCIACGDVRAIGDLIRFVVGPDRQIVPDVDGRLPGRGIWLSAERRAIGEACRKSLFAKAARRSVTVSDTLATDVEKLLLDRCLRRLGLARRAGEAVAGFGKVSDWIRRGGVRERGGLLLEACDGAADGKGKLMRLARALDREAGIVVTPVECFAAAELGRALGIAHAVHVVVSAGGNADALWHDARRLNGVRGGTANQCLQASA